MDQTALVSKSSFIFWQKNVVSRIDMIRSNWFAKHMISLVTNCTDWLDDILKTLYSTCTTTTTVLRDVKKC